MVKRIFVNFALQKGVNISVSLSHAGIFNALIINDLNYAR